MLKVHLPKYSLVLFYGEKHVIDFDYWTTAEDLPTAIKNIRVQLAKREFFSNNIGNWPNIILYTSEDLEVVKC